MLQTNPELLELDIEVPKDYYELLDRQGYAQFCWETYGRHVANANARSIKVKIRVV